MSAPQGALCFSMAYWPRDTYELYFRLSRIIRTHGNPHVVEAAQESQDRITNRVVATRMELFGLWRPQPRRLRLPARSIAALAPRTQARIRRGIANYISDQGGQVVNPNSITITGGTS